MEASKILTADVLDIIFNGRNKDYGAYELRRHYKQRLILSLVVMEYCFNDPNLPVILRLLQY